MNRIKSLKSSLKDKKGFTLIELIVVIAVIGILVLLAAPKFLGYTADANVATMQADTKVLSNAALIYHIENGEWPAGEERILANITGVGTNNYILNEDVMGEIKNLKNPPYQYFIDADTGEVYHLPGFKDKNGLIHYGGGKTAKSSPGHD